MDLQRVRELLRTAQIELELSLLSFAPDYHLPFHIVLEYVPDDAVATVVTAYIPSHDRWEANWKTRKRTRKKTKKKK